MLVNNMDESILRFYFKVRHLYIGASFKWHTIPLDLKYSIKISYDYQLFRLAMTCYKLKKDIYRKLLPVFETILKKTKG